MNNQEIKYNNKNNIIVEYLRIFNCFKTKLSKE